MCVLNEMKMTPCRDSFTVYVLILLQFNMLYSEGLDTTGVSDLASA